MMDRFHRYCVENGLSYYLVEGSMLGAARHHGYIPWDDDIDIAMPRKDYEALKKLIGGKVLEGRYLLESEETDKPDYFYPYAKLYDVRTTQIEKRKRNVVRGVGIDIFPLDGIGDSKEEAERNYRPIGKKIDLLTARVVAVREGRKWYKNLAVRVLQALPKSFADEKKLLREISELSRQRDFDKSGFVCNAVSAYRQKEIMPRAIYGAPTLYRFENIEVYGVEDYEGYLTHLYGDWRQLPPEDKRATSHMFESVDFDHSFLQNEEYLSL